MDNKNLTPTYLIGVDTRVKHFTETADGLLIATNCPDCGGNPFDPFSECLTCEATVQSFNRARAACRPMQALPAHRQALADRLADDQRDDRAA